MMTSTLGKVYHKVLDVVQSPLARKRRYALHYWKRRVAKEGTFFNHHYEYFYTTHYRLDRSFYEGKRILDIGCGPRGSLEWADMAAERVGLDPLAGSYLRLGGRHQKMTYVSAPAEDIPFTDGHFDVVCSFNSLDHVDDLDRTVNEIIRILARGGLFLLITDLHDKPRIREPQTFKWEVIDKFCPPLEVLRENRYESRRSGIYENVRSGTAYDETDSSTRNAVLSAKFIKPEGL